MRLLLILLLYNHDFRSYRDYRLWTNILGAAQLLKKGEALGFETHHSVSVYYVSFQVQHIVNTNGEQPNLNRTTPKEIKLTYMHPRGSCWTFGISYIFKYIFTMRQNISIYFWNKRRWLITDSSLCRKEIPVKKILDELILLNMNVKEVFIHFVFYLIKV